MPQGTDNNSNNIPNAPTPTSNENLQQNQPTQSDNKDYLPYIDIQQNENPSKLYAIPILGYIIKVLMIIPPAIFIIILALVSFVYMCINSFIVLFTGKFSNSAYNFFKGYFIYYVKTYSFFYGLTDKYPGFNLTTQDTSITVEIPIKENPSRLFAIPFLGFLIRFILLIPYIIFASIVGYGLIVAYVIAWIPVLFTGRYPKSLHEFILNYFRVILRQTAYILGLSDSYPSFNFPMENKTVKIILFVLGALLFLYYFIYMVNSPKSSPSYYNNSSSPTYY